MERLIGGPLGALEAGMRFRRVRQGALAANLANADTPGYRRVDVSFDSSLNRAAAELQRTGDAHLQANGSQGYRVERDRLSRGPDGNGVERDLEVIKLSRNAGAFEDQATVLARLFRMRRVAATGQP